MKPYQHVPITDCGEPLVPISSDFALVQPHSYEKLGAPYGDRSPFHVRQGVLERLLTAQTSLQQLHPGWKIQIFDAYRPLAVQQFMVDYTFTEVVREEGLLLEGLTELQRQEIYDRVYQFWAVPNDDPACPPPHSTGGAVDVTLVNDTGAVVDMGSAIDELSPRSYPNHFAESEDPQAQRFHQRRELLHRVMSGAGFKQHPNEWWHFCYGDQMWAWLRGQTDADWRAIARYGRIV